MSSKPKPIKLRNAATRAVFLDRDGVLNREVGHLHDIKDLRLLPGAAQAVRAINQMGLLAIIVTNQPVVAYGMTSEAGVDRIHAVLFERLGRRGATIDAAYYCPHHPSKAKLKKYKMMCACRKPNVGLIQRAVSDFHAIDLRKSFVVGDMTADIALGNRIHATAILVKTGHGGQDGRYPAIPDYTVGNLREAVKIIRAICLSK